MNRQGSRSDFPAERALRAMSFRVTEEPPWYARLHVRPGVRRAGLPRQSPALTPGQPRRGAALIYL
jgi:hypothetical protein